MWTERRGAEMMADEANKILEYRNSGQTESQQAES